MFLTQVRLEMMQTVIRKRGFEDTWTIYFCDAAENVPLSKESELKQLFTVLIK